MVDLNHGPSPYPQREDQQDNPSWRKMRYGDKNHKKAMGYGFLFIVVMFLLIVAVGIVGSLAT